MGEPGGLLSTGVTESDTTEATQQQQQQTFWGHTSEGNQPFPITSLLHPLTLLLPPSEIKTT